MIFYVEEGEESGAELEEAFQTLALSAEPELEIPPRSGAAKKCFLFKHKTTFFVEFKFRICFLFFNFMCNADVMLKCSWFHFGGTRSPSTTTYCFRGNYFKSLND